MFCANSGEIESHQLQPSRSCLRKHIMRANCQAAIWIKSLIPIMEVPGPEGHGWTVSNDNESRLNVDWTSESPAPDSALELLSCICKSGHCDSNCSCKQNRLSCTDVCRCSCEEPCEEDEATVNVYCDYQIDSDDE